MKEKRDSLKAERNVKSNKESKRMTEKEGLHSDVRIRAIKIRRLHYVEDNGEAGVTIIKGAESRRLSREWKRRGN